MNATTTDFRLDPEFEHLLPPLSPDEFAGLELDLQRSRCCRDPLIVWKEQRLLLDGHNRYRLCGKHGIDFQIREESLPDREAARAFIILSQMTRRNPSPEAPSYVRGKRYVQLKRQGERNDLTSGHADQKLTAARLASEYHVGEKTIRRDAKFAVAVDFIAGNCGSDCIPWMLSRDAGLPRGCVIRVAKMSPDEQQEFIDHLRKTGKPPRDKPDGIPMLRVSAEPATLVLDLIELLGPDRAADVAQRLTAALDRLSCPQPA